jgi:hypothetical protein
MQARHGQAFVKFNGTFPPAVVTKWEKMVSDWDKDKNKKNPYEGLFTIALVKLPDSLQNSLCATFSPFLAGKVQLS